MQISQSEIEIETIINRIRKKEIDLQPDFQRGDVWSRPKKRKLIDSVLRNWKIPPVHVIEDQTTYEWAVLDGQQRLTSIRDFTNNKFPVDGRIAPLDIEIAKLDKVYFSELDPSWQRRVMSYEVRFIKLKNFRPEESAELFYRLNQPTILTAAEQRNAFFGKSRDQIKLLVEKLSIATGGQSSLGFSNSRLAYDDVIARLCIFLEKDSVWEPVSSTALADKYRGDEGFSESAIKNVDEAIEIFARSMASVDYVRFTKASLLSWLYFFSTISKIGSMWNETELGTLVKSFERERTSARLEKNSSITPLEEYIFRVYNERLSYKVTDPISVAERDAIIWFYVYLRSNRRKFAEYYPDRHKILHNSTESFEKNDWANFVAAFTITDWGNRK